MTDSNPVDAAIDTEESAANGAAEPTAPDTPEVTPGAAGDPLPEGYGDAVLAALAETHPEDTEALKEQWGADVPINAAFARRTLEQVEMAVPGLAADLEASGLTGSPKVVAALAVVGRALAGTPGEPDSVRLAAPEAAPRTPAAGDDARRELQAQIDAITAAAWKDNSYFTDAVQARLQPLYLELHGNAPADGRQ